VKLNESNRLKMAICVLASLAAMPCHAFAQGDHGWQQSRAKYSQASICGDYAAIATYGANIARALGTESFDGKGNLTGSAIANQPGPNSTRSLTDIRTHLINASVESETKQVGAFRESFRRDVHI
jgi:ATP-dependent exoDNAse (exonuclease V) alpha subunit